MHIPPLLSRSLVLSLTAAALLGQQCEPPPELPFSWERFEPVRDRIVPNAAADAWRRIPWHVDLGAAIAAATAAKRPLLIWAMNGHPLGFT